MGFHPLNLGLRFLLELAAFAAFVVWGHAVVDGLWGWVLGIAISVAAMVLWGTFRKPGDESASGEAPVAVNGWVRLGVEAVVFGGAVVALVAAGRPTWASWLGGLVALHYALSWDRIAWLVRP